MRRAMLRRSLFVFLFACNRPAPQPTEPGLAVIDARVWDHPGADAVLMRVDRIVTVGRAGDMDLTGVHTIDARGAWVVPGFHDAHIHMMSGGLTMVGLDLSS